MKNLTYKQAYIKCLDIACDQAQKAYELSKKTKLRTAKLIAEEAFNTYQAQGALGLRLPKDKKKS